MTAVTPLPYTFSNGTSADANQVNENFTALAARIDVLEAQLSGTTSPGVAGRTYDLTSMSWTLQRYDAFPSDAGTSSDGFWNSEIGREVFRATFSAAGS